MSKRDGCKKVLFVCIGNACRSPMAEAIARRDAPDAIDAFSAGLMPIGFVPELTKQTLMKNGYWVEGLESKGISPGVWERVDVVINMSGRPKKEAFREHSKVVDWEIEDPFERGPEDYQRVFDKIRARVGELAEEYRREYAANRIAERRSRPRLYTTSSVFISLNGWNDAGVVNVSEDGLALSSDVALPSRPLQNLQIQFPGPPKPLKARCQIVWKSSNNKQAGIQFVGLTAEARRFIRTWISAQAVCIGFRSQIEPTRKAQNATALAERRAETRTPVNPPVYVDIENVNGGLVYNMTEDGIAMSAAMVLPGESPLKMRIELPGAGGWIEATGQIRWKSGSSKTVGIRLVGLPEETRKIIRNWLALERSKPAPEPEFKLTPGPHEETKILTSRSARPVAASFLESIPLNTDEPAIRGASAQFCERRVHPRRPIMPLSHVEVGPNNAGMLLNISESGLALIVAMRLAQDDLPTIRIHFADSKDSLDVSGQIAWLSESKREAGIRFVNLTDEARKRIALRIPRDELPVKAEDKAFRLPQARVIYQEGREPARIRIPIPADAPSDGVVNEHPVAIAASPWPALTGRGLEKTSGPIEASHVASQKSSRKVEPGFAQKAVSVPLTSGARTKRYVGLSAVLILAAVIALAIAGIASLPNVRTEMGGYVAQSAPNVDKPNAEKAPLSPIKSSDIHLQKMEAPPPIADSPSPEKADDFRHDSSKGSSFTAPAQPPEKPSNGILLKAARGSLHNRPELQRPTNQTTRFAASVNSRPLKKPKLEAAASPPPVPPALEVKMPEAANLVPTRPAEPKDKASAATLVKQPVTTAQMTGEVAVLTDPYPSLRADERGSKKQEQGGSLKLGHLLSRVAPVYPEEAKRQGIQGTVKLHAFVDRYWSVKRMQTVSGPAILGEAVFNAVRQWQYTETKLAGHPVETEVDVAVVFRLSNSATPKP